MHCAAEDSEQDGTTDSVASLMDTTAQLQQVQPTLCLPANVPTLRYESDHDDLASSILVAVQCRSWGNSQHIRASAHELGAVIQLARIECAPSAYTTLSAFSPKIHKVNLWTPVPNDGVLRPSTSRRTLPQTLDFKRRVRRQGLSVSRWIGARRNSTLP